MPGRRQRPLAHGRCAGVIGVLALNTFLLLAVDTLGIRSLGWLAAAVAPGWALWFHIRRTADPIMRIRHLVSQPFSTLASRWRCWSRGRWR
jgi:hypothetical protein